MDPGKYCTHNMKKVLAKIDNRIYLRMSSIIYVSYSYIANDDICCLKGSYHQKGVLKLIICKKNDDYLLKKSQNGLWEKNSQMLR